MPAATGRRCPATCPRAGTPRGTDHPDRRRARRAGDRRRAAQTPDRRRLPPTSTAATIRPSKVVPSAEAWVIPSPTPIRRRMQHRHPGRRRFDGRGGRGDDDRVAGGHRAEALPRLTMSAIDTPAIAAESGCAQVSCSHAAARISSRAATGAGARPRAARSRSRAPHMRDRVPHASERNMNDERPSHDLELRAVRRTKGRWSAQQSPRPSQQAARTSTTPAGASAQDPLLRLRSSTKPVSSSGRRTQIVLRNRTSPVSVAAGGGIGAIRSVAGTSRLA